LDTGGGLLNRAGLNKRVILERMAMLHMVGAFEILEMDEHSEIF
jgi:hypothetical protein